MGIGGDGDGWASDVGGGGRARDTRVGGTADRRCGVGCAGGRRAD